VASAWQTAILTSLASLRTCRDRLALRCGRHSGGCAGRRYRIPRSGRHSVFRMRFGDNFGG